MKIAVCLINHNQNKFIDATLKKLDKQVKKANEIYICSDDSPFDTSREDVTCINNTVLKGRCHNRNSVVEEFMKSDNDAIVFIDGDSYPKKSDFLAKYDDLLEENDLVFGTRVHTDIKGLKQPPSDLLTSNMDNLWLGKDLNYADLRIVSNAVKCWKEATTFEEKLDLMVTGMIGWSCNFGFTKKGLKKHIDFMYKAYGLKNQIFDSKAFSGNWGYEDVAMGIDALFAGLKIDISDDIKIIHNSHERTDGLFDHVAGRHIIMERARALEKFKKLKNKTYITMLVMFGSYIAGLITGMVTIAISLQ